MKKPFKSFILCLCLLSPAYSWAKEETKSFDTVTEINLDGVNPSISGIEKDTGNQFTVTLRERSSTSRYIINRCVPFFLTAIEKPGRYYLHLEIYSRSSYGYLTGCRLEVKS